MADTYVDFDAGLDSQSGLTWALAKKTIQAGITTAGLNGRVFVRRTNVGTPGTDTATGNRTLVGQTTPTSPTIIYGLKDGTTSEPPIDSDIAIRGVNALPRFEATISGSDIALDEHLHFFSIDFNSQDRFLLATGVADAKDSRLFGCQIRLNGLLYNNATSTSLSLIDCEVIAGSTSMEILWRQGGQFFMLGGLFSGSSIVNLIDAGPYGGSLRFNGVDLSNIGTNLVPVNDSDVSVRVRFSNCKFPPSHTLANGAGFEDTKSFVEAIGCIGGATISGNSIRAYEKEMLQGSTTDETTIVRTGGANDGASGAFSYALTPNIDSTTPSVIGVESPILSAFVAGDGTTAKTFTVYLANSGAGDYTTDEVWLELYSMASDGGSDHDLSNGAKQKISGGAPVIVDDTTSTWATGGGNPQKIQLTATPGFSGVVYCRVFFAKRFAANPETLYVDPKIEVA